MTSRIQHRRATVAGGALPQLPMFQGELAVNVADVELYTANGGTPMKMLGVRVFSTTAQYLAKDLAVYDGVIYQAKATVNPGPFTLAQWNNISDANTQALIDATVANYLPLAGGIMTGVIAAALGTAALPSIAFAGDTDTGIYRFGINTVGIASAGVPVFHAASSFLNSTVVHRFADGTAAAPGLTFSSDNNTGIYRVAEDTIGLTTAGTLALSASAAAISSLLTHLFTDGTEAIPGLRFAADGDTGIYRAGTNAIGLVAGANLGFQVNASSITSYNAHRFADGTAALPAISFSSETDLGFYKAAGNVIGIGNTAESFKFDAANNIFTLGDSGSGVYGRLATNTWRYYAAAGSTQQIDPIVGDGLGTATVQIFRTTNTAGTVQFLINEGDGTTGIAHYFYGKTSTGLGAQISRLGARTLIGHATDDAAGARLQIGGDVAIFNDVAAKSGITPNSNYNNLVIDSAGNVGITLASAAGTLGFMFGTPDSTLDGRLQYSTSARSLALYAGNSLGFTLTATEMVMSSTTELTVANMTPTSQYSAGFRGIPSIGNTATATKAAVGKAYKNTGNLAVNTGVFAADDVFGVYNNSAANITITQGSGVTLRLGGTATTGSRTLAPRGWASVFAVSATEFVVTGNVT